MKILYKSHPDIENKGGLVVFENLLGVFWFGPIDPDRRILVYHFVINKYRLKLALDQKNEQFEPTIIQSELQKAGYCLSDMFYRNYSAIELKNLLDRGIPKPFDKDTQGFNLGDQFISKYNRKITILGFIIKNEYKFEQRKPIPEECVICEDGYTVSFDLMRKNFFPENLTIPIAAKEESENIKNTTPKQLSLF